MSIAKVLTFSLTVTQLLVNKLRYRTIEKVTRLHNGSTPERPALSPSPIGKLPQELVGEIVSYFIYDARALIACSLTCYSWYIAAVPHLHHSLTAEGGTIPAPPERTMWPGPLKKSHALGLLPLVKRLRIRLGWYDGAFTPDQLRGHTLHCFSALTNLQDLGIDYLQLSLFMPTIRQCFGHFAPTLRFLALKHPNGSSREILYFIGLFPNLQDLKLHYYLGSRFEDHRSTTDITLVPLSNPPLRGWLTLVAFKKVDLIEDMITFFGGLRFHHMDLFRVSCVRVLLDACAETLETLRLYPTEEYNDNRALLRDFDLSRNKSLRTLETTGSSIRSAGYSVRGKAANLLKTVLSSVSSPLPLDVVIVYSEPDLGGIPNCSYCCSPFEPFCFHRHGYSREIDPESFRRQFEVFREMQGVRDFRLVLCADVEDYCAEHATRSLENIVKGKLHEFLREPLVIRERRPNRGRPKDPHWGSSTSNLWTAAL